LVKPDARHFPVAVSGVFTGRDGCALAETPYGVRGGREVIEGFDVREAEAHKIRQLERTRTGNMSKRVSPDVAVVGCIREFANADAVENNPDNALESQLRGHLANPFIIQKPNPDTPNYA
jgi:hypothetical protein